ncbi:hypothetical protein [Halochromatium glycolicum]|uniref:hypothetical protein n=1 Tax=Halochromatium glycolicum TaxID=85075 RepID=UPI00190BA166|nr:hypothetical protein [Halochromatium glycolicum]
MLALRESGRLGKQAGERAVERFAAPVVAEQYQRVYAQAAHACTQHVHSPSSQTLQDLVPVTAVMQMHYTLGL